MEPRYFCYYDIVVGILIQRLILRLLIAFLDSKRWDCNLNKYNNHQQSTYTNRHVHQLIRMTILPLLQMKCHESGLLDLCNIRPLTCYHSALVNEKNSWWGIKWTEKNNNKRMKQLNSIKARSLSSQFLKSQYFNVNL